ncbi:MAG: alpha-amylase family glycosyl hydrolase, partial [Pseudomonadota bacterium]
AGLRNYMIEMLKYWVRDEEIDGFRCDVAEMVPTDFWETARAALDSIKPVIMLSEGTYPEHHLKAFDLTYGWNLYGLLAQLISRQIAPDQIDSLLAQERRVFPAGSLRLRFSSNHDENAWDKPDVEKFGADGTLLAAVIVNTLPGVPLLYNGQEVGNSLKLGLFEKFTIDWNVKNHYRSFYSQLYAARKNGSALSAGSFVRIHTSADNSVYAFLRATPGDTILVAINFGAASFSGSLDASAFGARTSGALRCTDLMTNKRVTLHGGTDGGIMLSLPSSGFTLLKIN